MHSMTTIRVRGKVIKEGDKFQWLIWVTMFGSNDDPINLISNNKFDTRDDAIKDMKIAARHVCDVSQRIAMGKVTGEYVDMKTNETLNWDKEKFIND
jgi:hypothetical protein